MEKSTLSMRVFAFYLTVLGAMLLFWPSAFQLLGFEDVSSPWLRVLGYLVGTLAFYYYMAIREEAKSFYRWTVYSRMPLVLFYFVLVSMELAPPVMLLIGAFETGCAVWTAVALRSESAHLKPA